MVRRVEDESILRLLDPLDVGKPDLAPPEIWREYIRTVGRTPNGVWGGKLMWNQTPLLLDAPQDCPTVLETACCPRSATSSASDPVLDSRLPARRGLASGFVLARGADPGLARRPDPAATRAPPITPRRSPTSSSVMRAQEKGVACKLVRRRRHRAHRHLVSGVVANLTQVVGSILEALGGPQLDPEPVLERQADQRSDEWVTSYRADAEKHGLPT